MPRPLPVIIVTLIAVALVACGEEDSDEGADSSGQTKAEKSEPKPRCAKGSKVLVDALRSSLKIQGGGGVTRVNVVRLKDPPTDNVLPGYKRGVFAVAATFTGPGMDGQVGQWAASKAWCAPAAG